METFLQQQSENEQQAQETSGVLAEMGREPLSQITNTLQETSSNSQQVEMKTLLNLILEEIRELKKSQAHETAVLHLRLEKNEESIAGMPARLEEAESRIAHLEDQMSSTLQKIREVTTDKIALETKVETFENYTRRSNLRIVGVPEGSEGTNTLHWVETFIKQKVLPDYSGDLTMTRALRVPGHSIPNAKYPRTILINLGDYRIKENILTKAIQQRQFVIDEGIKCRIFQICQQGRRADRRNSLSFCFYSKLKGLEPLLPSSLS